MTVLVSDGVVVSKAALSIGSTTVQPVRNVMNSIIAIKRNMVVSLRKST